MDGKKGPAMMTCTPGRRHHYSTKAQAGTQAESRVPGGDGRWSHRRESGGWAAARSWRLGCADPGFVRSQIWSSPLSSGLQGLALWAGFPQASSGFGRGEALLRG